jgi:hypothetical protein
MRTDDFSLSTRTSSEPLEPDLEKYRVLLGDIELQDEQANAILMEIWTFAFKCVRAHLQPPSIPDIFASLLLECSENDPVPIDSLSAHFRGSQCEEYCSEERGADEKS